MAIIIVTQNHLEIDHASVMGRLQIAQSNFDLNMAINDLHDRVKPIQNTGAARIELNTRGEGETAQCSY